MRMGARGLAGAAFTGLLAFALHLLVDFHLKIPALAMIGATVAALVTREAWRGPEGPPERRNISRGPSRWAAGCTAVAALGFTAFWIVPKFRAEEFRRAARARIDAMAKAGFEGSKEGDALSLVSSGLARAGRAGSGQMRSAWSGTRPMPSRSSPWSSPRKPWSSAPMWSATPPEPRISVRSSRNSGSGAARTRHVQRQWTAGGDCFVHALNLAPMRADIWYYEAYHLSLSPDELEPAIADAGVSLRLDPGFLLAQLLRQRLTSRPKRTAPESY